MRLRAQTGSAAPANLVDLGYWKPTNATGKLLCNTTVVTITIIIYVCL